MVTIRQRSQCVYKWIFHRWISRVRKSLHIVRGLWICEAPHSFPRPPRNRFLSFQHISKWIAGLKMFRTIGWYNNFKAAVTVSGLKDPPCQGLGSCSSQSRELSSELSPRSAEVKSSYANWVWGGKVLTCGSHSEPRVELFFQWFPAPSPHSPFIWESIF